jgi:predicted ArsR family transcriptional regulator
MNQSLVAFVGESQARILNLLRRSELSIAALAQALDLSPNVIRLHLAGLERDGLVASSGALRTGGKPARLYTLTSKGDELFPKAYAAVLEMLTREIARQDGMDKAVALLQAVGKSIVSDLDRPDNLGARVAQAAEVLRRLGGEVDVVEDKQGWLLQGFSCPLSSVTAHVPQVCELARALVEATVGKTVEECCEREGRARCRFRVEA